MRKLSAKWVPKCLNADQKRQRCQSSEQFWDLFGTIKMISCRDWWPWMKPGYITMKRRQTNNQCSGGIAAHHAPKNSECKNVLKIFSPLFLGSRRHPPCWLSCKVQAINAEYYSSLLVQLKDILKEKRRGKFTRFSCSGATMRRLTGHLQPRKKNWPTWVSNVLRPHPILMIWPVWTTICSLDWKKQLKYRHFSSDTEVVSHCCRGDVVERATFWMFFSGLQKLQQRAKKCIELREHYVE